jgi:HD-GYP domain-containing protein (c-di-GMP phosphodiesterase class II)
MLVEERTTRDTASRFTVAEQASAFAVILREEFGVPFAFFDALTLAVLNTARSADSAEGDGSPSPDPKALRHLLEQDQVSVTPAGVGYRLSLVLYEGDRPVLVATGEISSLARAHAEGQRERARLQKWLQAVSDRLRLSSQLGRRPRAEPAAPGGGQNPAPWEALLSLDQLMRRLRPHRARARDLQRILETAFPPLGAQTLVWIPRNGEESILVQGEDCLAPEDYRQLAGSFHKHGDSQPLGPRLYDRFQDRPGAARFPHVVTLMALPVADQVLLGWVVAINKKGAAGFRKSDVALLTPFVALLELHLRTLTRHQELNDLLVGLTRSLTTAIDAKDSYTYGHSERVARIAVELGRELGMEGEDLGDIYLAGLLHDVGKIGIRDSVLRKPGKLTDEEQEHIRQHVTIGHAILADLRQVRSLLAGVLYHHERYDGQGYPEGLAGENIPFLARILAVADAYDAMTTSRPYREGMPLPRVEQILAQGAGTQWDKRVVEAFMRCRQRIHAIRQRGVGESLRTALEGALRSQHDRMVEPIA